MRQRVLLAAMAVCAFFGANSAVLSPEAALERAMASDNGRTLAVTIAPSLAYTAYSTTTATMPGVYVFNNADGNGFLAVNASDQGEALLGYSPTGAIDANNLAPNLKYWLEYYANELAAYEANGYTRTCVAKAPQDERAAIAPITKTLWDQDAPYNNLCPTFSGSRAVTGCVATAMAQVMKCYNYPTTGTGSNSYTCNGKTLTVNFGNTTYDWANMLDVYKSGQYTTAQGTAVATLMYSCGVSVNMEYSADESGAVSFDILTAWTSYFKYDKQARFMDRTYYPLDEWQDIIYNELASGRPVIYGGSGSDGGHEFVCDGYSADGYFHFNWGWSGLSDGYFLLTALDPLSQGIGGNSSGFNSYQDIIVNVKPDEGGAYWEELVSDLPFQISTQTASVGGQIQGSVGALNNSATSVTPTLGFAFVAENGTVTYAQGAKLSSRLRPGYSLSSATSLTANIPTSLTAGTYTVRPAYKDSQGTWHIMPVSQMVTRAYTMVISNGQATFTEQTVETPEITAYQFNSPLYEDSNFSISYSITNSGTAAWYGPIYALLINSSNELADYCGPVQIELAAGETRQLTFVDIFANAAAGNYTFVFASDDPEDPQSFAIISDMQSVTINSSATVTPTATNVVIANSSAVDASNFQVSFTALASGGIYYDNFEAVVFPESGGASVAYISSPIQFLSDGISQDVTITGNMSEQLTAGSKYFCGIYAKVNGSMECVSSYIPFTVASTSGIDSASASQVVSTTYYNLQGVRVSEPAPGHYIRVDRNADGTTTARHQIVK